MSRATYLRRPVKAYLRRVVQSHRRRLAVQIGIHPLQFEVRICYALATGIKPLSPHDTAVVAKLLILNELFLGRLSVIRLAATGESLNPVAYAPPSATFRVFSAQQRQPPERRGMRAFCASHPNQHHPGEGPFRALKARFLHDIRTMAPEVRLLRSCRIEYSLPKSRT